MAEWLKAHAWKACIPQGIQGSNPCLSAIIRCHAAEFLAHQCQTDRPMYLIAIWRTNAGAREIKVTISSLCGSIRK